MDPPLELVSFLTRAPNRVATLEALADGPATRAAVQERTGIPRATLSRILADCRRRELLERDGHDFALTPMGELLAAELDALLEAVAAMQRLSAVRGWLNIDDFDFPVARLGDADVVLPSESDPLAPIRRAEALLAEGRRVRAVANSMIPGCLEAVWRAGTAGRQTLQWVTTPDALDVIAADPELSRQTGDLLESPDANCHVHAEGVPQALFVVDDTVFTPVKDDAGNIRGHVETADGVIREWAEATIDRYVAEAERIGVEAIAST